MAKLTLKQAEKAEKEMRKMERDPNISKRELRLFMQSLMPCGHIHSNLLTCPDPPWGCVVCLTKKEAEKQIKEAKEV